MWFVKGMRQICCNVTTSTYSRTTVITLKMLELFVEVCMHVESLIVHRDNLTGISVSEQILDIRIVLGL